MPDHQITAGVATHAALPPALRRGHPITYSITYSTSGHRHSPLRCKKYRHPTPRHPHA
jgi:hypothetical protein